MNEIWKQMLESNLGLFWGEEKWCVFTKRWYCNWPEECASLERLHLGYKLPKVWFSNTNINIHGNDSYSPNIIISSFTLRLDIFRKKLFLLPTPYGVIIWLLLSFMCSPKMCPLCKVCNFLIEYVATFQDALLSQLLMKTRIGSFLFTRGRQFEVYHHQMAWEIYALAW